MYSQTTGISFSSGAPLLVRRATTSVGGVGIAGGAHATRRIESMLRQMYACDVLARS
jgi:hypothetical protein